MHKAIPQGAGRDARVLLIIEAEDFSPDTYDRMTARMDGHGGDGSSHPAVSHVAALTEGGGMVFVDVWDSADSFGRYAEQVIAPAGEGENVPELEPRFVPIHRTLRGTARV